MLFSERLLAVLSSSSPECDDIVLAATSCARRIGEIRPVRAI